jgi:hypothetical protein
MDYSRDIWCEREGTFETEKLVDLDTAQSQSSRLIAQVFVLSVMLNVSSALL